MKMFSYIMKFVAILLILLVGIAVARESVEEPELHEMRVCCDLVGGIDGDRCCASHCLVLGFAGGYCNHQKVCVCRR